MKMMIDNEPAFHHAIAIIERIESFGYPAYFVGGAVRDLLVGRHIGDIDIASSATPEEIMAMFDKVIPVGMEHGTVIVRYLGESYEITTFRSETGYQDHRHPDRVEFVSDVREDLARRDFTINAMAMDKNGGIVDPYHGQKAINEKYIQAVGNPDERFEEDPLRLMRAVRFVSQLGYRIEAKTLAAINQQAAWLKKVSVERIAIEYEKMFQGPFISMALELCRETGLYHYFPVFHNHPNWFAEAENVTCPLGGFAEIISYHCYHHPETKVEAWTKAWKRSRQIKNDAKALISALEALHENGLEAWLVYHLPVDLEPGFIRLASLLQDFDQEQLEQDVQTIRKGLVLQSRSDLAFQAKQLLDLYPDSPKGPWIGELLAIIEKKVISRELPNDYNEIKEWVIKWNPPDKN